MNNIKLGKQNLISNRSNTLWLKSTLTLTNRQSHSYSEKKNNTN